MQSIDVAAAMGTVWSSFLAIWDTPGTSEFLAALVGGGMTLLAQRWALKHDREKEEVRLKESERARAWAIFFKIHHVLEVNHKAKQDLDAARLRANSSKFDLWQTLQFPVQDWDRVEYSDAELLFLIGHRQFDLMTSYQEAVHWCYSLIQSVKIYRNMRVEFLTTTPSAMTGTQGALQVTPQNQAQIMPKISHLQSLAVSIERLVQEKHPEIRALFDNYSDAMKEMVGEKPNMKWS